MSSAEENASILGLAKDVLEKATTTTTKYIQSNNAAEPTFSAKSKVYRLDSSRVTRQRLVEGPTRFFYRHYYTRGYELAASQLALDSDFFTLILAGEGMSSKELAK
ncbi:hypothetical protein PG997_009269 [Apiospora hydei]|uniref:Uncharacterized protein n=1 Tax=Apiospora hydei TaxID=1337664 RepID=A0ABR1VTN2_9PEZI